MGYLKDNLFLINGKAEELDIDELFHRHGNDSKRMLVDDEIGTVLYTADLDIYFLDITPNGELIPKKVNEIKRSRFSTSIIRIQIGGKISSYSADTIFLVKKDDYVIKVRADKMKKGMVLATGEKVY